MITSWMIAISATGLLLACAVALATRIARLYSGFQSRFLWLMPTVGVCLLAAIWALPVKSPPQTASARAASQAGNSSALTMESWTPVEIPPIRVPALASSRTSFDIERAAVILWLLASGLLAGLLTTAGVGLLRERREWRRTVIGGLDVLVAPDFGPAVVGVLSPTIVLPEWALHLEQEAQCVMVLHESEHVRVHDQRLLAVGLATAVAMPWNPAAWLSLRGLRRSIETDCDARVVARGVERSTYATVLLDAWSRATGHFLAGTAFVEESSRLGNRVELLMRPKPRRRAMKTAVGISVAAVLVFIACAMPAPRKSSEAAFAPYPLIVVDGTPRPDLHARFRWTGMVVPETTTTPRFEIRYHGKTASDTTMQPGYPKDIDAMQDIAAPAAQAMFGEPARYGALLLYTKEYRARGGKLVAPGQGITSERAMPANATSNDMIEAAFNHTFRNITLTDAQRTRAHEIIAEHQAAQRAVTADSAPLVIAWPRRVALTTRQNALLRDLLTSPADRLKIDSVFAEHVMPTLDLETTTRSMLITIIQGTDLDAARKTRALGIVRSALQDEVAAYERNPNARAERARIVAGRDSSVRALLTVAERASLDSLMARVHRSQRQ